MNPPRHPRTDATLLQANWPGSYQEDLGRHCQSKNLKRLIYGSSDYGSSAMRKRQVRALSPSSRGPETGLADINVHQIRSRLGPGLSESTLKSGRLPEYQPIQLSTLASDRAGTH